MALRRTQATLSGVEAPVWVSCVGGVGWGDGVGSLSPPPPPRGGLSPSRPYQGSNNWMGRVVAAAAGLQVAHKVRARVDVGVGGGAPTRSTHKWKCALLLPHAAAECETDSYHTHTHTPNPMLLFKALNLIRLWDKSITPPHPPPPSLRNGRVKGSRLTPSAPLLPPRSPLRSPMILT